jgi:hypothetical protein
MNIRLSRYLAVFLGIVSPLLETIRRWHTWQENPPAFFDDFLLGGLLLYGAWRVSRDAASGQKYLVGAWGFALGMIYSSFFFQLQMIREGATDPAPISSEWVAAVKGVGFVLVLIGFITSLGKVEQSRSSVESL